jgi:ATP-dependent RNA helicase HelY
VTAPAAARAEFEASYGFPLDPFQIRALDALDAGRSVLVAAPTGSGKTVVGEYAVAKALAEGGRAFYTTPLKALSNQKFGELSARYGTERVGLLTGDNAINGGALVVVMTTEVLRNMIYAASPALDALRTVVLDEVHYLQDRYRGSVWEEVIIHAPPEVTLACLSATVSNAEEVADWVQTVRGPTTAVIEERRPVELNHLYMVGERDSEQLHLLPTFVRGLPNPEAARLDSRSTYAGGGHGRRSGDRRPRSRLHTPRRSEVVERLGDESMLPAIHFIFSRAACDDAVRQCLDAGLRLTTEDERGQIRAIAERKAEVLSDDDLAVLEYGRWSAALESGLAAHHAGMVPPFKEAVEACFAAGLVKAVFATETLALGINMPARSVVIEKLSKFTGERHEFLTPGEYTQLTGRAGRRGIDEVGYAVVLWSPFVPFDQVASLASKRTYPLTSSFRPTYNMAANLVRRYPSDAAHHLLNLSFAQYSVDREVVRLEAHLEKAQVASQAAHDEARCDRGDIDEYRKLERTDRERGSDPGPAGGDFEDVLGSIRPGDVLLVPGGKAKGPVAVLTTTRRRGGGTRLGALTVGRRYLTLTAKDFSAPPRPVGRLELPKPYAPRSPSFQRSVARDLGRFRGRRNAGHREREGSGGRRGPAEAAALRAHPVASCPDLRRHLQAAARAERLDRDVERLERRIHGRTESLARQFDRVLRVLQAWGYLDGWSLTDAGHQLGRIYHECDLLVAEALRSGLLDDLDAPAMAALASAFTYELRRPGGPTPTPWFPSSRLRRRWTEVERLSRELNQVEDEAGLPLTRAPDAGFFESAHGWAAGEHLSEVLDDDMSPGDFVRNIKQLIDLLRQLGDVATEPATAKSARGAADQLFRGIVAASSVVGS